ncbi:MAG TPA: DUF3299 domain-containing protein [Opitutaceae bacterium]|nr:DUF3299 domain-containing protein [Opitutaceae bacterium]
MTQPAHKTFSAPARKLAGVCRAVFLCSLAVSLAAQAPVPPPASTAPVKISVDGDDVFAVGFDKLAAFEYTIVDAATGATPEEIEKARQRDQVPDWIKLYQDKRVALTGYLMPLQVENGLSKKFIMMRDITTCCFGNVPNMNEYVIVTMKTGGVKPIQDVPVVLVGVFKIEEKYENGYVVALYQMDGEKFLGPKK